MEVSEAPISALIDEKQIVVIVLGSESYGLDIFCVSEIVRMQAITPLPNADEHVLGLLNLRGKTIPVINLGGRLEKKPMPETEATRIVIAEVDGERAGLLVDAVHHVMTLTSEQVEPISDLIHNERLDCLQAIARTEEGLITLIDLEKVLNN